MCILAKIPIPDINDKNIEETDFGMMNNYFPEAIARERNVNPEFVKSRI